ncbi:S-layer homology domain-containing protein [Fuchsiella alkaliacetigena]|uniref:S-layer homology domain-containing protein n=1 Tax=Fuchsiella alkaliacetigena TaxID=957042 RepID=UPI00200A826F|nr:S-layer homology domain-containing protein [Fuchsiella alkaliacetigena]MCK8824289.1 S-layer homology domain-containing protein [Fuchsiella alkaliacetigena]
MKNKLIILLAVVMVFAMTVPVIAKSYSDVSIDHWAYEAVQDVSEMGIITGFEDGTFRGEESLNRYQMAMVTARIAEQLAKGDLTLEEEAQLTEIKEKLAEFEAKDNGVSISGELGVEYKYEDVNWDEDRDDNRDDYIDEDLADDEVFVNPYAVDGDQIYSVERYFQETADFDITIEKEGIRADLELGLKAIAEQDDHQEFVVGDIASQELELDNIFATVTTEDFVAKLGEEQEVDLKDYLFFEAELDGITVEAGDYWVGLGQEDQDTRHMLARKNNILDLPANLYVGVEDQVDNDRETVVAVDTEFTMMDLDWTGEFATNDSEMENKLLRVGVAKDLDLGYLFSLEGNIEQTENFNGIKYDDDEDDGFEGTKKGYDFRVATDVDKVKLAVLYEDYEYATEEEQETTLSAEVLADNPYSIYGVNLFGNYEYKLDSEEEVRYVEASRALDTLTLTGIYDYESDDTDDKLVSLDYASEMDIAGINFRPQLGVAAIRDDLNEEDYLNKKAGLEAAYAMSEKITLTGGYAWADKEHRVDIPGEMAKSYAALDYKIAADASASLSYEEVDFSGVKASDDFDVQSLTADFKLRF